MDVAPRAGAWIETMKRSNQYQNQLVAPRAGAWIETNNWNTAYGWGKSHPVRVRGLKHDNTFNRCRSNIASHPVRVRGLKPFSLTPDCNDLQVAPRAGAWIETLVERSGNLKRIGRTPCGCVD